MGRELAAAIGRWSALEDHPVVPGARRRVRHEPRGAALVRPHRLGHPQDDRPPPPARGRHDRRPLPRRPPPPPRGALPRRGRRRQGLPRREAVRHRSRRRRADRRRDRGRRRLRALLQRDAVLPRRAARLRDDRRRARSARSSRSSTTSCTRATSIAPSRSTGSARRATAAPSASWATSGCTSPTCRCGSAGSPRTVYAQLCDLVTERPDPQTGEPVPCDTIDNATLHCDAGFPLTLRTHRIAPGHMNTWRILATGMDGGVSFSTAQPKTVHRFARARRPPGLGAPRGRKPVGLRDHHGTDLRVRLRRRDPADVGLLPGRASGRAGRSASAAPRPPRRSTRTASSTPRCAPGRPDRAEPV